MTRNVGTSAPLGFAQRYAGFNSVFWLWAGGNVLLTNFISGSAFAVGVGFVGLLVLSFAVFCLGFAWCSWSSQRSARYGIDEIVALRPAFGHRGANYGTLVLVGVNFGWVGILASMAGTAMQFVAQDLGISFQGDYLVYAVGIGILAPLLIVMYSQKAAFTLAKLLVPLLLGFLAYIVLRLITDGHLSDVVHDRGDGSTTWAGAFEILFAFAISWFPYLGSWNRFARTERASFWGTFLGLLLTGVTFAVVGGMATLATGEIDPARWADELDLGLVSLLIIMVGTIISVTHLLGSGSMGILSTFPRTTYRVVCLIVTVPSLIFVFASSLQDTFNVLLIFIGLLCGPYWAVAIVDYLFLRRERLDVAACFTHGRGPYWYTRGYNVYAFACAAVGMLVWIYLGGWTSGFGVLTFSSGERLFGTISATLPAMLIAGLAYYIVGRAVLIPRGIGGYSTPEADPDAPDTGHGDRRPADRRQESATARRGR